jgi:hypothetical protein
VLAPTRIFPRSVHPAVPPDVSRDKLGVKWHFLRGFTGRIADIYDYIINAKEALIDAKEEVSDLNKRITDLESALARKQSMKMAYGAYWTKEGGPFCQLCWEYD